MKEATSLPGPDYHPDAVDDPAGASNLELFAREAELAAYLGKQGLYPCEAYLFEKYLRPGLEVLELGCGRGRVTRELVAAGCAARGIDHDPHIIERAGRLYPDLDLRLGDARRIEAPSGALDAVVFSYNGIDYLPSAADRAQCLDECRRVLRTGGLLLFSSHNLKSFPLNLLLDRPRRFYRRNMAAFPRAEMRIVEPEYGGYDTHHSSLGYYRRALASHRFELLETAGDRMLEVAWLARCQRRLTENYIDTWLYYVARKPD